MNSFVIYTAVKKIQLWGAAALRRRGSQSSFAQELGAAAAQGGGGGAAAMLSRALELPVVPAHRAVAACGAAAPFPPEPEAAVTTLVAALPGTRCPLPVARCPLPIVRCVTETAPAGDAAREGVHRADAAARGRRGGGGAAPRGDRGLQRGRAPSLTRLVCGSPLVSSEVSSWTIARECFCKVVPARIPL